jgi:hypothetical protein
MVNQLTGYSVNRLIINLGFKRMRSMREQFRIKFYVKIFGKPITKIL